MPCPHARADWRTCPHCLGINNPLPPIPDPFIKAKELRIDTDERSVLQNTLREILKKVNKPLGIPLLTTPGSRPNSVSDATPDGTCECCKQSTWLSPSSKRTMEEEKDKEFVIICLKCVEEESRQFEWPPRGK